jgi:hypothetical protein
MHEDLTYLKLYRKTLKSQVFRNEGLLKVWIWCLCKASFKKRFVSVKTGITETEVEIFPGQFIFGRHSAAKQLKMKTSTVRNRIEKLRKLENLDIKPDTHYSVITILNWESYQGDDKKKDTNKDNGRTAGGQPEDTNKNVLESKRKKLIKEFPFPETYSKDLINIFCDFIINREVLKKKVTQRSFTGLVNKLNKLTNGNEEDSKTILEEAIINGWSSFYPIKNKQNNNNSPEEEWKSAL